jgi:hypothetical protein
MESLKPRRKDMFKTSLFNQASLPLVIEPDAGEKRSPGVESLIPLYAENKVDCTP